MATTSTVCPTPQHTTPTIPLEDLGKLLVTQWEHEREVFLSWVDQRERLLGISPRTAEIRKWWNEQQRT